MKAGIIFLNMTYNRIKAKMGAKVDKGNREKKFPMGVYKLCVPGLILAVFVLGAMLGGCSVERTNGTKVSDLEYSIVEESELPEELHGMIEEKKTADFKLTYEADDELYIVRGYGEQATGGYSIRINECYLTSNAAVFDTELVGPRKGESVTKSPSFPYVVIKTALQEKPVVFD